MFGTINTLGMLYFLGIPELFRSIGIFKNLLTPEVVLAVGGFIFNILALPTLLNKNAVIPKAQSVPSSVVLFFCFAIPYYSIDFHLSAVANTTGAILWALIAVYRSPDSNVSVGPSSENEPNSTHSNTHPADD